MAPKMMSATGQTRLVPASSRAALRGFTLIELVLALSLVVVLAGSLIFVNYVTWQRRGSMEEGTRQFEASLRLARAEAAATGKRLRLEFSEDGSFKYTWEKEPLTEPGAFEDYTAGTWASQLPREIIRVRGCLLTGASPMSSPQFSTPSSETAVLSPITFYPDGSCDCATIQIGSKNEDETRTALVELDGVNGVITTRLLLPSEWEEYQKTNSP